MLLSLVVAMLTAPGQALALCFNTGAFQTSTLCWNPVNPIPAEFDIENVLWNPQGPEYLAVGGGGAILTSVDGVNWTPRDSGTVQRLFGSVWDGHQYIVVGDGGLVLTSPDGINWTGQVTNTRARLLDIAVNGAGTRYVAVGESGTVLSSDNAIAWEETTVISATRPALYAITWHNNRFVAVGSSRAIITSDNGTAWVASLTPVPGGPILRDIAVNSNSEFVVVGSRGTVFTSSNGSDWQESLIDGHPNASLREVVWAGNRYFAVGDNGNIDEPLLLVSLTGVEWSDPGSLPDGLALETLKTIEFNGTTTLVTGGNRNLLHALTADLEWEPVTPDLSRVATLNDLQLANFPSPLHIATGANGTVLSSTDGLAWASEISGTNQTLNGLAVRRDNGIATRIVAVGDNATILYSDDGKVWQNASISQSLSAHIAAVTWGNLLFIAVGADGTILSSPDGVVWDVVDTGFSMELHGVTYGLVGNSPLYVAVGAGGTVLTSANGAGWTSQNSQTTGTLNAVLWNDDNSDPLFVAVGQTAGDSPSAAAIYSANGINWFIATVPAQSPAVPASPPLRALEWNGSQYLAASDNGSFLRSSSGRGWTTLGVVPKDSEGNDQILPRINAIAWTGDRFLAAGEGGFIVASGGVDLVVDVNDDTSVSEDDDPHFAQAGIEKTFRFLISNIAVLDATNVQFSYTLPEQVSILAPPVAPAGWNCSLNGNAGASCNTGRLVAGTGDAVIIELKMIMPTASNITIIHNVEVPAVPINDIQPVNNVLTVDTRIGPRPAPGLPSPDSDFTPGGAFSIVELMGLLLLAMATWLAPRAAPHLRIASARP